MKVKPIPHASFEIKRARFIQILCHCSVSRKTTPPYFFSSNFGQKTPIEVKFSDFWSGWVKIHQIPPSAMLETLSRIFFKLYITI